MRRTRAAITSELVTVESMLAEDRNFLEQIGLKERLENLRQELSLWRDEDDPVFLTFSGDPVEKSQSIIAEFGSRAVTLFADAFAGIDAHNVGEVKGRGRLQSADTHQLRITNVARGSFGFEFRLPTRDELPEIEEPPRTALEALVEIFQAARGGEEDELAELLGVVPDRVLNKLREFALLTAKSNAGFSIAHGQHRMRVDAEDTPMVAEFLREDTIQRTDVERRALFTGILPRKRRFEATTDDGEPIAGRIEKGLGELGDANEWLKRPVILALRATSAHGSSPSYVLTNFEFLDGEP